MLQPFDNLQPPIYLPPQCSSTIKFTKNYNSKLYGRYFTSIRIPQAKWVVGSYYDVILDDRHITYAQLLQIKILTLDQLPEYTAMLDTGLNLDETKNLLISIYTLPIIQAYGIAILMFDNVGLVI
jgi:hypothetical protein